MPRQEYWSSVSKVNTGLIDAHTHMHWIWRSCESVFYFFRYERAWAKNRWGAINVKIPDLRLFHLHNFQLDNYANSRTNDGSIFHLNLEMPEVSSKFWNTCSRSITLVSWIWAITRLLKYSTEGFRFLYIFCKFIRGGRVWRLRGH
jgi:hypothetical protein